MKKYTYLVNFDSQTLERVGESFAVKGDGGIAELEFVIPSNFGVPANQALWRVFFKLPGEKESLFETLPTVAATQSGDYVTAWVISKAITQKAGRLAFSLAAISGNDIQWNSRTAIMQVPESQYQPESEEAEEPYTGRLTALEGDIAAIRGEFAEVQDDFEELKETATLGTPIPESLVANMTEGHVYIYTGTEPGYTAGHVYYYVGGALTDGGVYGGTAVDATLTQSGQAADAKKTGDEISQIKEDLTANLVTGIYTYTGAKTTGKAITSGRTWSSSTVAKTHVFKIPDCCTKIKVTANETETAIIAFLATYDGTEAIGDPVNFSNGFTSRITLNAGASAEYSVSGNMNYFYALILDTGSINHTPTTELTGYNYALKSTEGDRSAEIETRLRCYGACALENGAFSIGSTIAMPESSALTGINARLIMSENLTEGATVRMSSHCTVSGLDIDGGLSSRPTTEGTRHGIEWTGNDVFTGFVDKCVIHGFSGSGIYLHDSTAQTYRNLLVSNCRIYACYVGIDFNQNTEFSGVSNCTITSNYYGIRNRGGNNRVDCCGIDANYCGMLVDMDVGENNGHGSVSNCTFNHSNSNNGYGIIIRDTGRMIVTGCNLYFSKILLENTNGNIINGCGFGNSTSWEITGGECNVFANCMIRSTSDTPITITNNTQTKVVNCYTRDGAEVTV